MAKAFKDPGAVLAEAWRACIASYIEEDMDRLQALLLLELYWNRRAREMVVGPDGGVRHGVLWRLGDAEELAEWLFRPDPNYYKEYCAGPTLPSQVGIATVIGRLHDDYMASKYYPKSAQNPGKKVGSLLDPTEVFEGPEARVRVYACLYNEANHIYCKVECRLGIPPIGVAATGPRRSHQIQGLAPL